MVLGEEGEYRPGALGSVGHVVALQRRTNVRVAVVADCVEVAVEPGLAGGQPVAAKRLDEAEEQPLVGFAAHPVGVGVQVGRLG